MCRQRHTPLVKAQLAEDIDPTGFLEPSVQLSGIEVSMAQVVCMPELANCQSSQVTKMATAINVIRHD